MSDDPFDRHAVDYDGALQQGLKYSGEDKMFFAEGRLKYLVEFLQTQRMKPPKWILDLGCGVGDVTCRIADNFPQALVRGADTSSAAIGVAAEQFGGERVEFVAMQSRVEAIAQPESMDLIHLNGVIHHVQPSHRPALFKRMHAALRPGGLVALFENNPWNPGTRLVMSRIPFDRDADPVSAPRIRELFREASLEPIDTAYLFYFPRLMTFFRPMERYLRRLPLGAQYCVLARRA